MVPTSHLNTSYADEPYSSFKGHRSSDISKEKHNQRSSKTFGRLLRFLKLRRLLKYRLGVHQEYRSSHKPPAYEQGAKDQGPCGARYQPPSESPSVL